MCDTCIIEGWADEETTPTAYIAQLDTEETQILEHAEAVLRSAPKAMWNDDGTIHWYAYPLHAQIDDCNYDSNAEEHEYVWDEKAEIETILGTKIGGNVKGGFLPEPELTIARTWNTLTDVQRLYLCTKFHGWLHTLDDQVTETIARWEREEAEEIAGINIGNPKGCGEIECPPFQETTLQVSYTNPIGPPEGKR